MSPRALKFVFPLPPNLTNGRMHWRTLYRKKTAFYAGCDELQASGLLPPPPSAPFPVVAATVVMVLGAAMDDDNCGARVKWCWDWLTTRGYLKDDRKKNLILAGYPTQRIKRDENYRVEITVTPIDRGAP